MGRHGKDRANRFDVKCARIVPLPDGGGRTVILRDAIARDVVARDVVARDVIVRDARSGASAGASAASAGGGSTLAPSEFPPECPSARPSPGLQNNVEDGWGAWLDVLPGALDPGAASALYSAMTESQTESQTGGGAGSDSSACAGGAGGTEPHATGGMARAWGSYGSSHRKEAFFVLDDVASASAASAAAPAREYRYSARAVRAQPASALPPALLALVPALNARFGAACNVLHCNWYDGGSQYVPAHSDDEEQLVPGHAIWGLTLLDPRMESRHLLVRCKPGVQPDAAPSASPAAPRARGNKTKPVFSLELRHGDAYAMRGPRFQTDCTHEVPEDFKVLGSRVSITGRKYVMD